MDARGIFMRILIVVAAIMIFLIAVPVVRAEPKQLGDWLVFDNPLKKNRYSDGEAIHVAVTRSLERSSGRLGIWGCGRYSVSFNFESDVPFDGMKPEEKGEGRTRIVYSKVQPLDPELHPIVLEAGDVEHFIFDADMMARGQKFMICPTREEGPRCLTFSLRGITAALKAVCSRR